MIVLAFSMILALSAFVVACAIGFQGADVQPVPSLSTPAAVNPRIPGLFIGACSLAAGVLASTHTAGVYSPAGLILTYAIMGATAAAALYAAVYTASSAAAALIQRQHTPGPCVTVHVTSRRVANTGHTRRAAAAHARAARVRHALSLSRVKRYDAAHGGAACHVDAATGRPVVIGYPSLHRAVECLEVYLYGNCIYTPITGAHHAG